VIIIKELEVEKYRNIEHARLIDLRDLNILIGPSNCGKTSILELIFSLRNLNTGRAYSFLCEECKKFTDSSEEIGGLILPLESRDFYLREDSSKAKITLRILFDKESIEKLSPRVLKRQEVFLGTATIAREHVSDAIIMENYGQQLYGRHLSPFIQKPIIEEIGRTILYCPEKRLERYKEVNFEEYIQQKQLRSSQKKRWIDFLSRIVDARIDDERDGRLIRKVGGKDYDSSISEQGSGVRSLACLAVDILFSDAKVVLVDEPELGLNPFVRQEFLKFLLNESAERQIFLATHDPTFVNPVIWKNRDLRTFFYSLLKGEFLKIDLAESKEDPETFAGYMPHTTSLKDTHMYVEGASDLYIMQIFLLKHLKHRYENWVEIWNKIGIFHLAGDYWVHLLYTVPNYPYKCLIVLDGEKKAMAEEVCKRYELADITVPKFKFCRAIEEAKNTFSSDVHPIYCLERYCIEEYLEPKPYFKDPKYDKKKDGPKIAEAMGNVPKEIEDVFEIILPK